MTKAKAAIKAAPLMENILWYFAAIDAAGKSNYLVCTKYEDENSHTRFANNGNDKFAGPETMCYCCAQHHMG